MRISEIDSTIKKIEKEIQTKEQKQKIFELKKKYTGTDEVISSLDYLKENKKQENEFQAFCGLPTIDSWIKGFKPGTLNIISGLTKQGKTTFCQTMTVNFTIQGFKCLWFSLDTPPIELIERFKDIPLFYLPKDNFLEQKIDWIEEKIIEGLAKYDTKIVFIDNLEFLSIFERQGGDNYANQLGSCIIKLKQIAMKWSVVIFLNHHVRSIDSTKAPSWYDLKDSSGIAHHSDTVFMVWRGKIRTRDGDQLDPDTGYISLELQRRGGRTGILRVKHINNLFYETNNSTKELEL